MQNAQFKVHFELIKKNVTALVLRRSLEKTVLYVTTQAKFSKNVVCPRKVLMTISGNQLIFKAWDKEQKLHTFDHTIDICDEPARPSPGQHCCSLIGFFSQTNDRILNKVT